MKKKILAFLRDKKGVSEIAMDIAEAYPDATVEEISKAIEVAKVAFGIEKREIEANVKTAESEKVAKLVDKHLLTIKTDGTFLKSLNIQASTKDSAVYKTFDMATGKMKENGAMSEADVLFNKMFYAGLKGDMSKVNSISDEIDQENKRINKIVGKAANDPTASDVDSRGGYAIPTLVADQINQLTYSLSVMLQAMNTDNIMVEDKIYPLMYGATVVDIADQDTPVTEAQMTFTNPTVSMKRAGLYTNVSNTIIAQKANIIPAIITSFGSAFARFLDLRLAVGNVTGTGDLVDGLVFDANTNLPTPYALATLTAKKIEDIINTLSEEATGNVVMIGNRKVKSQIGNLENSSGQREFPGYLQGAPLNPFGVPFVLNTKIPSVLDITADAGRTGGSDDVLICADMSQVIAGISGSPRIDMSEHFRFTNDVTTIRGITRYGAKVLSSATGAGSGGGIVAVAQELTNA